MKDFGGPRSAPRKMVVANLGIRLEKDPPGWRVIPNVIPGGKSPAWDSFNLPRLPSSELEQVCGVIRSFWCRQQRGLSFLLYLDLRQRGWIPIVPPQSVTPTEGRLYCDFPGFRAPAPHMRLGGSIRGVATNSTHVAALAVPPINGLHFVMDPRSAWIAVQSFICIERHIYSVSTDQLVTNEQDCHVEYLLSRVRRDDVL